MIKKSISYTDIDGNKVTEDHWFHLSEAEIVEIEFGMEGGLSGTLQRIIETDNKKELLEEFKKIILGSFGVREGKRFIKNDQVREEFMETGAYSALFMEFLTSADSLAEFIKGVVPLEMSANVDKAIKEANKTGVVASIPPPPPLT